MDKPTVTLLTPEIAREYLAFKAKETKKMSKKNTLAKDPKRFLSYREELVPRYFSAQGFCTMINELRKKIWENKVAGKYANGTSTAFQDALYEVVISRTQNIGVDMGILKSLIGVLLHVFKDLKYQEYINQTEAEMRDVLSLDREKDFTSIREKQKGEEFAEILEELKDSYFFDQGLGNQTSSSENQEFFDQAWRVFKTEEIDAMPAGERNKLYRYLYEKYVK